MRHDLLLENARNRFFPYWWLNKKKRSSLYHVVCHTWKEYILAKNAKPKDINAEIIYKPDTPELKTQNT